MISIYFLYDRFESALELPNFPEMIFAENVLRLQHSDGFGLEFTALDALKLVDAHNDLLKVAATKVWREARYNIVTCQVHPALVKRVQCTVRSFFNFG